MTASLDVVGAVQALDRDELARRSAAVAPRLLGCLLTHDVDGRRTVGRIVEVEAYRQTDPASHSFRGRTPRTATMFGPPGHAYVYFTYGMHHCMNVSCEPEGTGAAVLLRSVAIVEGSDDAIARRGGRSTPRDLASGPGRLTQAMGIGPERDGDDLLGDGPLRLGRDGWRVPRGAVRQGPRTGVRDAPDRRWRWWIADVRAVSPYRRHPQAPPPGSA